MHIFFSGIACQSTAPIFMGIENNWNSTCHFMEKNVFYGMALTQKYIAIYGRIGTGFAIKYIFLIGT